MGIPSDITGTWAVPSTMVEGDQEFMHIGCDARIVHFVQADNTGKHTVPMKLWLESLGNHTFEVRTTPTGKSWEVRLIPTESGITIDRGKFQFHLTRTRKTELPSWYHERLEKALSMMADIERETREAEQGSDGKSDTVVS